MKEMLQTAGEPVIAVLLVLGALLSAVSAFGLIRLPDVYLRSHAATKSTTLGVLSVMLAGFLYFAIYEHEAGGKWLLAIFFVFITAPVGGHLIGRAAYRTGVPLSERTVEDDLKDAVGAPSRNEGDV